MDERIITAITGEFTGKSWSCYIFYDSSKRSGVIHKTAQGKSQRNCKNMKIQLVSATN